MNFDEAFKHYQEGTATQEEKDFVLDELAKAKAFSPLLDDEGINVTPAPVKEADINEVKAAKKEFKWKRLAYAGVAVVVLLMIIGAVLGGVFGVAADYAGRNIKVGQDQARVIAVDYAVNFINDSSALPATSQITAKDVFVKDIDKDFHFELDLTDSYYTFDFEMVITPRRLEVEVRVDTRDGSCRIVDIG